MMSIAATLSLRSTCMRGHVGCVVTDADGFILSTGYNGAPRGMPHCFEAGCLIVDGHCVRTAHAEQNAIITAGRHGVSLAGSHLYTSTRPCLRCIMMLIQAGVQEITYENTYDSDDEMLAFEATRTANVRMVRFEH